MGITQISHEAQSGIGHHSDQFLMTLWILAILFFLQLCISSNLTSSPVYMQDVIVSRAIVTILVIWWTFGRALHTLSLRIEAVLYSYTIFSNIHASKRTLWKQSPKGFSSMCADFMQLLLLSQKKVSYYFWQKMLLELTFLSGSTLCFHFKALFPVVFSFAPLYSPYKGTPEISVLFFRLVIQRHSFPSRKFFHS